MEKKANNKSKYDWKGLKLDFYQSEYDEVKAFFEATGVPYNRFTREKAKWWAKDKQEWKDWVINKALAKEQEKRAKELEIPIDQLKSLKKSAILLYAKHLNKYIKDEKGTLKINVSDLDKIIKSIKVELWEPTTITKNENINKDEVIDEKDLLDD